MRAGVVVTHYGLLTPIGDSIDRFRSALFEGASGVRDIRGTFVDSAFPVPYAALLPGERTPLSNAGSRYCRTAVELIDQAIGSAPSALAFDALIYGGREPIGFDIGIQAMRDGEISNGALETLRTELPVETASRRLRDLGHRPPPPTLEISFNNACATGNSAIGMAFQRIRAGAWKRALVMAIELDPNPLQLMNLYLLGALSIAGVPAATASRPFSVDRSGFVKGEAAGVLVLESADVAADRGATVHGRILGYGAATDAWRLTDGRPDNQCVIRAMETAIGDSRLSPGKIDYISGHATSTPLGDRLECEAIKKVFEKLAYDVPVSSLKSQIGHSTLACGVIEAIASLLMLQEQRIAPTINFTPGDPSCDLDFVPNASRAHKMSHVLSNNFGFGGQNSCIVLGRA